MLGSKESKTRFVLLLSLSLLLMGLSMLWISSMGSSKPREVQGNLALAVPETWTVLTTTTTVPPTTLPPQPKRPSRAAVGPRPVITGDIWGALARCESGGRPNAISRSGKYFGAFQFSLATWRGVGMSGNPIDYPYEVQLEAAKRLQARSGWGQWPVCSRKLGLR